MGSLYAQPNTEWDIRNSKIIARKDSTHINTCSRLMKLRRREYQLCEGRLLCHRWVHIEFEWANNAWVANTGKVHRLQHKRLFESGMGSRKYESAFGDIRCVEYNRNMTVFVYIEAFNAELHKVHETNSWELSEGGIKIYSCIRVRIFYNTWTH